LALSTFTVVNANDSGAGSLRQAILDATKHRGLDTIGFAPSLTASGPATIALSTIGDLSAGKSAFLVNSFLDIIGPFGPSGITITLAQGAPAMRFFHRLPVAAS
jgi:hypothetical protein